MFLTSALISSAWAADGNMMQLVMLPAAQYNATCTDGTSVGYYWRPAPQDSPNHDKVVLWLKGGAYCSTYDDCVQRQSKPGLGSSKAWPQTYIGNGIQSPDKTVNPDFFDWNHAYLEYCTGDLWTGEQVEPVNPWGASSGPQKFTFTGHLYLSQVLDHLEEVSHGAKASEFILTGGSAGGVGTFVNADYVGARPSLASAKYRAMPQGGFFGRPSSDYAHFKANTTDPDPYQRKYSGWLSTIQHHVAAAETKCLAHNASQGPNCASPLYMYPFTTTKMFIAQAAVDFEQCFEYSGCPSGKVYTDPETAAYVEYQHGIQAPNLGDVVVNGPKAAMDGLFAPACLGHTLPQLGWSGAKRVPNIDPLHNASGGIAGQDPQVDGMYAAQAFGDWYFERTAAGSHMHLDSNSDLDTLCKCNLQICGQKKD